MLVDTGSTYIVVKPGVVGELGFIRTPYTARLVLADGRVVDANVYVGEAEVMGRRGPVLVVIGGLEEVSPEGGYLLGLK
jgi:predicted aspartyl protease